MNQNKQRDYQKLSFQSLFGTALVRRGKLLDHIGTEAHAKWPGFARLPEIEKGLVQRRTTPLSPDIMCHAQYSKNNVEHRNLVNMPKPTIECLKNPPEITLKIEKNGKVSIS